MTKPRDQQTRRTSGKPRLSEFAHRLRSEWRQLELPVKDVSIIVGVSGGADSVALLLALEELSRVGRLDVNPIIAHLDHRLRKTSREDARWVRQLAKRFGYPACVHAVDIAANATINRDNVEQSARKARYGFFADLAKRKNASHVLTAHTLDDQAETVLMNLMRGAGGDGLAGIDRLGRLSTTHATLLVRPLVSWARRADTEGYCHSRGYEFLVDEMNADEHFARVRVRRQLLPLMASFNPRIAKSLARVAELAREDNAALNTAADDVLRLAIFNGKSKWPMRLNVQPVLAAPAAVRRRVLREWLRQCRGDLKRLERVHILAVEGLLVPGRGGRTIELPGGATILRKGGLLEYTE